MSLSKTLYDSADYYDANEDQDWLQCEDEDDAIEAAIYEMHVPDGVSFREHLLSSELEIFGFRTKTIPPMVLDGEITDFVDKLNEHLSKEYSDPDSDEEVYDHKTTATALLAALATVKPSIWRCESSGSRILSGQELLDWVDKNKPEWLP